MRISRWTMALAAGCMSATAFANPGQPAPPAKPDAPGQVQTAPLPREGDGESDVLIRVDPTWSAQPAGGVFFNVRAEPRGQADVFFQAADDAPPPGAQPRERRPPRARPAPPANPGEPAPPAPGEGPADPFGFQFRPVRIHRERGAYLGVGTSPAAPVLRRQLGLTEGMGLVVDAVVPDSPAAEAGLKEFDVLQKLDDQFLVNPEQLAVLVRSHKPGDEIKLTLIRDGQKTTVSAKLTEHELDPVGPPGMPDFLRFEPGMPAPRTAPEPQPAPPGRNPFGQWLGGPNPPSTLNWLDENKLYTFKNQDGKKTLTVKDMDGNTLFEGPIDTARQRGRLPTDIKEKLDKMTNSGLFPPAGDGKVTPRPKPEDRRDGDRKTDQPRPRQSEDGDEK